MSEQSRKILALALGVSFFALIVVLAAFFLFSPGKGDDSAPFSIGAKAEPRQKNPSDYLANAPQDSMNTQTTSAGDIIIVYGNEPSKPGDAQASSSSPTTIVVSPSTKSASPTPSAAPTTLAPATAPSAAATAKDAPVSGDYWIQAGSFSVKNNADALKALFEQRKLPVSILVKEVDGKNRYTVRVGPYPSRAEASKWLSAAKSVKGAEQSWITQ
ncbi:MAG: SPOR domain-containing protein [Spirochaetia bacterium]|nr:SPOR domain-containing protein [Spirochaetia bacterium]